MEIFNTNFSSNNGRDYSDLYVENIENPLIINNCQF